MPDLNLPPRLNGEIERLSSETRTVVIIGANGAGKSRFTRSLAANLGDSAFRLNALDALYILQCFLVTFAIVRNDEAQARRAVRCGYQILFSADLFQYAGGSFSVIHKILLLIFP